MEITTKDSAVVDLNSFRAALYADHLQQTAAAYEPKVWSKEDPELTWLDACDFDHRIEVLLDALVIGADPAAEVCRERIPEGDFGDWFAGMSLFCRLERQDLLEELLGQIDVSDEEIVDAVSDALARELPASLHDEILLPLFEQGAEHARIAAHVCVCQRLGFADYREVIDAYARAAVAPVLLMAISQGQEAYSDILSSTEPERTLALGVFGDIRAIPELIAGLSDSEIVADTAQGLFLLTGAPLYEEVFVPQKIDPDTLFEEELEKYERKHPGTRQA